MVLSNGDMTVTMIFCMIEAFIFNNILEIIIFHEGISQTIKEDDLRRLPYLKWCVLEAVRLRPTGIITRRVVKSFTLRVS